MRIVTESGVSTEAGMPVDGGMTMNVFPLVERWLAENVDRLRALQHVAVHKGMDRYRSMIDFLFCETFIDFKESCFRFYDQRGPELKGCSQFSEGIRTQWERQLLVALEYAYRIFQSKRDITWTLFRLEFLQLELLAA